MPFLVLITKKSQLQKWNSQTVIQVTLVKDPLARVLVDDQEEQGGDRGDEVKGPCRDCWV